MKSDMNIKVHEVQAFPCGKVLSLHGWSKEQLEEALFKNVPTSTACWHCCHNFTWAPVRLPYQRDIRFGRNVYYTTGVFCSFNCAKGYKLNQKSSKTSVMDIAVLANKMRQLHMVEDTAKEAPATTPTPLPETSRPAAGAKKVQFASVKAKMVLSKSGPQNAYFVKLPASRNSLKMFGGKVSIDEYRDGFMRLDGSIIGTDPTNPLNMLKKRKRNVELPSFIDDSIAKMVRVSVAKTGILQNHRLNEKNRFYSNAANAKQSGPTVNPHQYGERAIQQKLEESRVRREVKSTNANHRLDSIMKLSIKQK